jgi:hypothetical protein
MIRIVGADARKSKKFLPLIDVAIEVVIEIGNKLLIGHLA